jgi:hypothetical protein
MTSGILRTYLAVLAVLSALAATASSGMEKPRYAVIASPVTLESPEWRTAAEALAAKHSNEAVTDIIAENPTNALARLREIRPRYVAFLMRSEEFGHSTLVALKRMMREIDEDPFDDAIWGIVTGPDSATALRIARSENPKVVRSVLATTGVEENIAPGEVAVLSDANPPGEWWRKGADGAVVRHSETGSVERVFADAWATIDPELMLTSSHATERNLEMPFSLGNLIATNGTFAVTPKVEWRGEALPLPAPKVEKVWLAPGNCLIANHTADDDMVMTALSFGKVNQFAGYIKKTWFGFAGWTAWRYFGIAGYPMNVSHYAANQWLVLKLHLGEATDPHELAGLMWDLDATVFYGDPMQRVYTDCARPAANCGDMPAIVIFPSSSTSGERRIKDVPEGCRCHEFDDFALIFPRGEQ